MFTHESSTERKNLNGVTTCTFASAAVGRCYRCTRITRISCVRALPAFVTTDDDCSHFMSPFVTNLMVFSSRTSHFYRHFISSPITTHDGNDVLLIVSCGASEELYCGKYKKIIWVQTFYKCTILQNFHEIIRLIIIAYLIVKKNIFITSLSFTVHT